MTSAESIGRDKLYEHYKRIGRVGGLLRAFPRRRTATMDTNAALPEAPKKKKGNHWLLWWKIEPEELQKNIVEYDTLRIYQSARRIKLFAFVVVWDS